MLFVTMCHSLQTQHRRRALLCERERIEFHRTPAIFVFFVVRQIVQMDIPDTGHRRTHKHINIRTRARFPSSFTCMRFLFHCVCTSVCVHVCHLIYERNAIAQLTRKILRHNIVVVCKCACVYVANVNNRVTRLSRNVQKY